MEQNRYGRILEHLVFLKRLGYEITVGRIGGKEIDFSCKKQGDVALIKHLK